MFNRYQAEKNVMQIRGHSLPVHHSVVYHGNYLVPFHQPISAHAISSPNCHWNVSLPSGASPWNSIFRVGPGRRSKHNNHPLIIFQNSTCGIFFMFVSITLTHILQNNLQRTIMAENTKRITWTTANKILLRRRPSLYVTLARLIII